jgi:uncharacterized protein YabE (DUF348 family)
MSKGCPGDRSRFTSERPTPWTSNIVSVLKDKEVKLGHDDKLNPAKTQSAGTPEVRITVDNRAQNKAIRRTHYPTNQTTQKRRSKNLFISLTV